VEVCALIENLNQLDADIIFIKTSIILLSIKGLRCIKRLPAFIRFSTKVFFYLHAIDANDVPEQ
jgi:hypothetical protein